MGRTATASFTKNFVGLSDSEGTFLRFPKMGCTTSNERGEPRLSDKPLFAAPAKDLTRLTTADLGSIDESHIRSAATPTVETQ
jgi:hypothetical protein